MLEFSHCGHAFVGIYSGKAYIAWPMLFTKGRNVLVSDAKAKGGLQIASFDDYMTGLAGLVHVKVRCKWLGGLLYSVGSLLAGVVNAPVVRKMRSGFT